MNKVRTIVIDGLEIQTSLSAVEIANLPIKYAELERENQKYKETFDKAIKYIEKHTNNNTEYLDVWEVREILDILKEVE